MYLLQFAIYLLKFLPVCKILESDHAKLQTKS